MAKTRNDRFVIDSTVGITVDETEGVGRDLLAQWLGDDETGKIKVTPVKVADPRATIATAKFKRRYRMVSLALKALAAARRTEQEESDSAKPSKTSKTRWLASSSDRPLRNAVRRMKQKDSTTR